MKTSETFQDTMLACLHESRDGFTKQQMSQLTTNVLRLAATLSLAETDSLPLIDETEEP